MNLNDKLFDLYEANTSFSDSIPSVDYWVMMKNFLLSHDRLLRFNPYEEKAFEGLNKMLLLEMMLSLSKEDGIFIKHYVLECPVCMSSTAGRQLEEIFHRKQAVCDCPTPPSGEARYRYLQENMYYEFTVSDGVMPLIDNELKKKAQVKQKTEGVDKHGE